jgi:pimeloyl-ACP methyl ester carboxylesterase
MSKKIISIQISEMTIIVILLLVGSAAFSSPINGKSLLSNKPTNDPLPVLLIHGYRSDSSAWQKWEDLLKADGIQFQAVTFKHSNDACGSSTAHARELNKIIDSFKKQTGAQRVNIVAHSKGGLDARVFLANSSVNDVANLIMIGTPNAGAPLASPSDPCSPAVKDFIDHSPATKSARNMHTQYYTIAGDWNPFLILNCPQPDWLPIEVSSFPKLPKPNDGLVLVSSVESQSYFHNLGHTSDCHSNMLSDKEYEKAKPILSG